MKLYKIFFVVCPVLFLLACKNDQRALVIQSSPPVQIDSFPGNCPYLTKNNKGNTVISWARMINDSTSVFCYAVLTDDGKSFEKIVTIPYSDNLQPHSENLPKIVFKPSGEIIALWGAANPNPNNKYSGLVFYSQSFDGGINWSKPKSLVNDTSGYDQRYYDVALLPNGEAAIIWLDNRKTSGKEGSALYFASTEGNTGFRNERIISEGCCQCCRTDLFIDSKAGIHVLYRGIIKDSIRDMLHTVSVDGGQRFAEPKLISNDNWVIKGCPHTGPAMTENKEGLHFVWFTGGKDKGCFYTQSNDNGKNFNPKEQISVSGAHPQISSFPGGDMLVAWDEPVQVDNKYYKRISVQRRTEKGIVNGGASITSDTLTASYPAIATLNNDISIIAYNEKRGEENYIMIHRLEMK